MNEIQTHTQINNYFKYRQVNDSTYNNYHLSSWIKLELYDKKANILDYGCGFGQILKSLRNNDYQNVYGVDIENEAIKHCLASDLNVKKLNLNHLENPFDFKFDVIIMSHVIEHIAKHEIINTLLLIKKNFLSNNGKLLIAVPNAQSNTDCYWAYEDWTHTTLFTSGSLYYILKAAGFEHVEFIDIDCTLGASPLKKILRIIFLFLYKTNKKFWNKITCSYYHQPSPQIFSYEIKAKAY
jgi:2-polyprenyl-3-methyl-5-hydroxy-6-metoxy-1,4-benzoquinol methylase